MTKQRHADFYSWSRAHVCHRGLLPLITLLLLAHANTVGLRHETMRASMYRCRVMILVVVVSIVVGLTMCVNVIEVCLQG